MCLSVIIYFQTWTPFPATAQAPQNPDTVNVAQIYNADSAKKAQQLRADSLAKLRAYKSSDRYKDSMANIRQIKLQELARERTRIMDSIRMQRKAVQDSIVASNKRVMDSVKAISDSIALVQKNEMQRQQAIRKQISDSMAIIRAYKQSQGYKDSIALVNKNRVDSMKAVRAAYNDSVRAAQRKILDSITAERRKYNDSLRTAQQAFNDSVKAQRLKTADSMRNYMDSVRTEMGRVRDSAAAARKIVSDSLAKIREQRAAEREIKTKEKEKKKKLALEIKLENEKQSFTNEKLRKKGWGFPRRTLQNTYTRYNYYFNANLKMQEAIQNMRRLHKDSFEQIIALFPFNPDRDSARLKSDMDTIIQKTSLGIQLHDPRGKWQDDLYLLMGQAFYYKGDYENAANAFKFIVHQTEKDKKEKSKKNKTDKKDELTQNSFAELEPEGLKAILQHAPAKNEAILWLARVLVQQKDYTMAALLLDMLKNDVNFPKHWQDRLALEYANLSLATNKNNDAIEHLAKVFSGDDLDKYTQRRAGYIVAQLYQQVFDLNNSTQAFEQVIALHPPLDMDFNARMNIVRNNIESANVADKNYAALIKMSKDDKFKPYYDQIYYALGKHHELTGNESQAIEEYRNSIAQANNNNLQKGTTYVALGDLFYKNSQHLVAAQMYDSATQFLTSSDVPMIHHASKRATLLYKVAEPANIVKNADSLLHLSSLNENDRKSYVRQYLKDMERRLVDSYYNSLKAPAATSVATNNGNNNKSFYFTNTSSMAKGALEFKQKWPNRELKDNWRRSVTSGGFDMVEDENLALNNLTPEEKIKLSLPSEDSLLLAIPTMPQHIDTLNVARLENLYLLGKGYFYDLEDYKNTMQTFGRLDSLYPDNKFIPETYYIKYLVHMRQQQPQEAEYYYNYLVKNYPQSSYTIMMMQALSGGSNDSTQSLDAHYDECYNLITTGKYEIGLVKVEQAYTQFPVLGEYRKQYDLLRVIGNAGQQKYDLALTQIEEWLKSNPKDSLTNYAKIVRDFIVKNKAVQDEIAAKEKATSTPASANNYTVNTGGINDPQSTVNPEPKEENNNSLFSKPNAQSVHYVILLLPLDNRIQGIRAGLNEYNRITSGNENIAVTLNALTQEHSVVLCKQFNDQASAINYRNKIRSLSSLFKEYTNGNDVKIAVITTDNYGKLLASKKAKEYLDFASKNYK